jgi:hypothetical protein
MPYTFIVHLIVLIRWKSGMTPTNCLGCCKLIVCGDSKSALSTLEISLDFRKSTYGRQSKKWVEVAYDFGIAKSDVGLFEDAVTLLVKFILL